MTDTPPTDWQYKYIELLRKLIDELKKGKRGWTLGELEAIKRLQEFEDSLPWNK